MGPLEAATGGEILGFASIVNWPGEEEEYEEETEEDDPEVRSLHNQVTLAGMSRLCRVEGIAWPCMVKR